MPLHPAFSCPPDPSKTSLNPRKPTSGQLDCVCENKVLADDKYYRLQDERVLAWLKLKATPPFPSSIYCPGFFPEAQRTEFTG